MFQNIWLFITRGFKGLVKWLTPKASTAVAVINALKMLVEAPAVTSIVNATVNTIDNSILNLLKAHLPKISEEVLVAEGILTSGKTQTEMLDALIAYLRTKTKAARAKFYVELAAKLTQVLADGKVTINEAIAVSQMIFQEEKAEKLAVAA